MFFFFEWVRTNLFYGLSLLFIYFTYSYLLKEKIWKSTWPHILYYFVAVSLVGIGFNYFLEPNYIHAGYKIFTNRFSSNDMSNLIVSSFFWIGWAILFSQIEKFFIEKLEIKKKSKSLQNYLLCFFIYILFLNLCTIILNQAFERPI